MYLIPERVYRRLTKIQILLSQHHERIRIEKSAVDGERNSPRDTEIRFTLLRLGRLISELKPLDPDDDEDSQPTNSLGIYIAEFDFISKFLNNYLNEPTELDILIPKIDSLITSFKLEILNNAFQSNENLSIELGQKSQKLNKFDKEIETLFAKKNDLEKRLDDVKGLLNGDFIGLATDLANKVYGSELVFDQIQKSYDQIDIHLEQIKTIKTEIDEIERLARLAESSQNEVVAEIKNKCHEAELLAKKCREAFNLATAAGLGGAFKVRSSHLMLSGYLWLFGLIISLITGGYLGFNQANRIQALLEKTSLNWNLLIVDSLLFLSSIGGPIWVAWIATRQIGYRFRLEEDYAYKASVAQAYQGFKEEARGYGKEVEERLFKAALSRLEESPLRHVDSENHGSPWHELFSKIDMPKIIKDLPTDIKEKLTDLPKVAVDVLAKSISKSMQAQEKLRPDEQEKSDKTNK